jgi:phosphatidylserine synthase 2
MKDAGVQTQSGINVSPRILSQIPLAEEEFPQILYKAHTVLWLQGCLLILGYIIWTRDDTVTYSNTKQGATAAIVLFIFVSAVHLPDSGFLSRPHPVLWKILQGMSFCYLLMLAFMVFQNLDDARSLLKWLDVRLGVPLSDDKYAEKCEFFTPDDPDSYFANVKKCFFDMYILAHAVGWWFKMIIVRDLKLCIFLSVLFEFMEITLRHQLPNFWECWWDSLILDIIVCNGFGILIGWLTCRACQMKQYYWGIGKDSRTQTGRFSMASRSAMQLTPYSWSVYKWEMFSSSKNFVSIIWYIVFVNLVDLSNFYLKFLLWIPANNWILLLRVLFWAVLAIASTREYYEYVASGYKLRLGVHCWIAHLLLFLEWMIVIKNSSGIFNDPMPYWIQYVWSLIIGFLITTGLWLFYRDLNRK